MALRLFSVLVVCAALSVPATLAAQCMPDMDNPCKARCNGTSFDISKAFDFPINITEPRPRPTDQRTYWYMWSPCTSYDCPGYKAGTDCAFCQKANLFYSCGETSRPIWLWEDFKPGDTFPNWTVQYTFGTTWRIVIVKFIVEKKLKEPVISFISEDPYLQYNFEIRGACIGQESFECQKYYQARHSK